jgi:hypothetical protein
MLSNVVIKSIEKIMWDSNRKEGILYTVNILTSRVKNSVMLLFLGHDMKVRKFKIILKKYKTSS